MEESCKAEGLDFGGPGVRARLERRVSWTPGAEGAPREGRVEVGWAEGGAMRRDWEVGG